MSVKDIVLTIVGRLLLIVLMSVYIPFLLAIAFVSKEKLFKSKAFFFFGDWLFRLMLKCTCLPITFIGKENIPQGRAIFAANHQSSLDIPILGSIIQGRPHVWLALVDLMQSFLLRHLVKATVLVDMSSPMKGMRTLLEAIKVVNENNTLSVMIFPEGGRYTDGKVHDFFSGFAILAQKSGLPVVPVYILGANIAYPPKTFWMRHVPIKVIIGKPFVYQEGEEYEQFKDRVYAWFVQQQGAHADLK